MRTDRFYKVLIVMLLLLNMGTLGYLWKSGNTGSADMPMSPPQHDRMLAQKLHMTETQLDQFQMLKDEHHGQMIKLHEQARQLHVALFALLKERNVDTVAKNNILHALQQNSDQKERVTFEHFVKLRGILTPDQQPLFDDFVEEFSRRIMQPGPGPRP